MPSHPHHPRRRPPRRCARPVARAIPALLATLAVAAPLSALQTKPVDLARTLLADGVPPDEMARKLAETTKGETHLVVEAMAAVGVTASRTAVGLRDGLRLDNPRINGLLLDGGFRVEEVINVALKILRATPAEWAEAMRGHGADVMAAAAVLRADYGLAAAAGGRALLAGGYTLEEVARSFREVWRLTAVEAGEALREMSVSPTATGGLLAAAGYDIRPVKIASYRIDDYRPGREGQYIENVGVLDRARISGTTPGTRDGEVEILVTERGLQDLVISGTGERGRIVARIPHRFSFEGESRDGEWLRVRFPTYPSPGWIRVIARGRQIDEVTARPLGYQLFDPAPLLAPLEGLELSLGEPEGRGELRIPAATVAGIAIPDVTTEFAVPPLRDLGLDAFIVGFASRDVRVAVAPTGDGRILLELQMRFEEEGAEVVGTLGPPGGPRLPFEADIVAPNLTVAMTLGADPATGRLTMHRVEPRFRAEFQVRTDHGPVNLAPIRDLVLAETDAHLLAAVLDTDLGHRIADALDRVRGALGWGEVRGLHLVQNGRWLVESAF